ncbi:hypothetical protein BDN72DRAFT_414495 [Pluteus cervinus]|uniref:Uncharacterized protein n=1 Tax=Pluteus cervinus TaxID=181527 RepID=A0ACD3B0Z7_9AGAR|nr:hypothetical protein BDN72DRAFT_414495 [Pluteus cervinus]
MVLGWWRKTGLSAVPSSRLSAQDAIPIESKRVTRISFYFISVFWPCSGKITPNVTNQRSEEVVHLQHTSQHVHIDAHKHPQAIDLLPCSSISSSALSVVASRNCAQNSSSIPKVQIHSKKSIALPHNTFIVHRASRQVDRPDGPLHLQSPGSRTTASEPDPARHTQALRFPVTTRQTSLFYPQFCVSYFQ